MSLHRLQPQVARQFLGSPYYLEQLSGNFCYLEDLSDFWCNLIKFSNLGELQNLLILFKPCLMPPLKKISVLSVINYIKQRDD